MALPAGRYGVTKRQLNKVKNLPVNTIGMIEEAVESVTDLTKSTIGWLTQNKLKLPYYSSSVSGDITATVNSDGTITLSSGTAIIQEILYIRYKSEEFKPDAGTYKISKGFTNGKIGLVCEGYNGDAWVKVLASSFSNDEITFDIDYVGYDRISIYLNIQSGAVSEGITVVPILEHLAVSELMDTKADNSVIGNVESVSSSAHAYIAGQGFICDGQYRVAKGDGISIGDEITNSNSDINPISQILTDLKIKSATFSGTTNSYGNKKVDTNKIIVAVKMNSALYFANILYDTNGDNYVQVRLGNTGEAVTDTVVSGTYYYL